MKIAITCMLVMMLAACTKEVQNKFGRAVQNWTGTNGVLEIYAGEKLVKRFLQIDKLSTAVSIRSLSKNENRSEGMPF